DSGLFETEPSRASDFVVQCEDFGIPQARHRIILLGLRQDVTQNPKCLKPRPHVSAREVLEGLPMLRSKLSQDEDWVAAIESELSRIPDHIQADLQIFRVLRRMRSETATLSTGGQWRPTRRPVAMSAIGKWLEDENLAGVLQHEARSHMASDLVRYLY